MSGINPIRQILGIVRKTANRRYTDENQPIRASATPSPATSDLVEQYKSTLESTGSVAEGLKAIVSIQLANEFGEAFLKDPDSKSIINKIVKDLGTIPEIKEILNSERNS